MADDVVIVGAGPNGLVAAHEMSMAGRSVRVVEAMDSPGGGVRSGELTLPGFVHDIFAAVFPLALVSPALRNLPLDDYGLRWVFPSAPVGHPLDDGPAVVVEQDIEKTVQGLGIDGPSYRSLVGPLARSWDKLVPFILNPLTIPVHPLIVASFGLPGFFPAGGLARVFFRTRRARALFAGFAAHGIMPLTHFMSSSFALVMAASAHATSWPFVGGGAGNLGWSLAGMLESRGVKVETGRSIGRLDDLGPHGTVFLEQTPRQVISMVDLPSGTRRSLGRWRYGPGICKVDWALDGPVPWTDEGLQRAGTVHVGGAMEEIALAEEDAWRGRIPERPFVLLTQPSLFDGSRVPAGKHTAWAYCHVPNGCVADMSERIECQVERFAPGFRDRVLARNVITASMFEGLDANLIGGDITGGAQDLKQLIFRPQTGFHPHRLLADVYLCSASTSPGGGVHGMCGLLAAREALRRG